MALVDGTNCGFVQEAPLGDPDGDTSITVDGGGAYCSAFTSPAGSNSVTEMGWYNNDATEAADFDIGIYSADASGTPHVPNVRLAVAANQAKGTSAGWHTADVSYPIENAETEHFLALECDATDTATHWDFQYATGANMCHRGGVTSLLDPFGSLWGSNGAYRVGIYALYEAAGANKLLLLQNTLGGDANRMTA